MPRRDDLRSILVIGSGPIVIGQACEFDYSGTQPAASCARRATGDPGQLQSGHHHDGPATADRTYIEPLDAEVLEAIIEKERLTRCCRRSAGRRPSTSPWSW